MEYAAEAVVFCFLLWVGWQDGKAGPLYMLAGFAGVSSLYFAVDSRWIDAAVCVAIAVGLALAGLVRERFVGER